MPTRLWAPFQTKTGNSGRLAAAEQEISSPCTHNAARLCGSLRQQILAVDFGIPQTCCKSLKGGASVDDGGPATTKWNDPRCWWRSNDHTGSSATPLLPSPVSSSRSFCPSSLATSTAQRSCCWLWHLLRSWTTNRYGTLLSLSKHTRGTLRLLPPGPLFPFPGCVEKLDRPTHLYTSARRAPPRGAELTPLERRGNVLSILHCSHCSGFGESATANFSYVHNDPTITGKNTPAGPG